MRIKDLRACDCCDQPLTSREKPQPFFARITVRREFINPIKLNQFLGLAQMFGGRVGIASAMGDDNVTETASTTELMLCDECLVGRHGEDHDITCLPIMVLMEKRSNKEEADDAKKKAAAPSGEEAPAQSGA